MRILVFDTETGGLNSKDHSVFSVGGVVGDLETGEIITTFEALHKLPSVNDYKFTSKAVEIHGITPAQAFKEGLTTEEIQAAFMDLWLNNGAAIMGGHNVNPFDVNFMSHGIYKFSPEDFTKNFTYRFVDSLPLIRLFTGNNDAPSGASLTQVVKSLNIDMDEWGKNKFHAALFDSVCCFKVLHKFRKVLCEKDVVERLTK